jgi:predicted enzyme related to lactoylglutathione lyase
MVKSLHTLWCFASDMDKSAEFYRDLLGFEIVHQSPYWTEMRLGDIHFGLHPLKPGMEAPAGVGPKGWFVGLGTDDLKGLRAKLEAAGTVINGDYHEIPGGVILEILDPEGNVIHLAQMGVTVKELT